MRTRGDHEAAEETVLAPWAERAARSLGREHAEEPHAFRSAFQRDRARIVHSKAFRRLEYKTQVFLNGTGDHYRTRLTHTMEVASVSRAVAMGLGANADLAEAIALAHDLGHPPVGHSGEETLNRLMQDHGGFEHNRQSLRIVRKLESRYPDFDGLNLSHEVLEGIDKHSERHTKPGSTTPFPQPGLEAQIANICDEITYYSHDLDDGIEAGLLSLEQLESVAVWKETLDRARQEHPRLSPRKMTGFVIRCLIDQEVEDLIRTTSARIAASGACSPDDIRRQNEPMASLSPPLKAANREMRAFLYKNVYFSPMVAGMNSRACRLIEDLFLHHIAHPGELPPEALARIDNEGLHTAVCDHISGMTDRYLMLEHARLFG